MSLTLYTSPGCHLCEQAEEMLDYLNIPFTAVDISTDVGLVRKYGVRIPVLHRAETGELCWPFDTLDIERFSA